MKTAVRRHKKVLKKKHMKVTHMCISVPTRLRKQMMEFQAKYVVNWSAIAAHAFRERMKNEVNDES